MENIFYIEFDRRKGSRYGTGSYNWFSSDKWDILMRYTCIYDKNNKRVWEWDVIDFEWEEEYWVVYFDENRWMFCYDLYVDGEMMGSYFDLYTWVFDDEWDKWKPQMWLEVIGNIHVDKDIIRIATSEEIEERRVDVLKKYSRKSWFTRRKLRNKLVDICRDVIGFILRT